MTKGKLANKQYEAFCQEIAKGVNQTQAAIKAKYSPKTAGVKGSQLLTIIKVQARIEELAGKAEKRNEISIDKTVKKIKAIAYKAPEGNESILKALEMLMQYHEKAGHFKDIDDDKKPDTKIELEINRNYEA